jgi:hypothetical protein
MYELHENEQYFFDPPALDRLVDFVVQGGFHSTCCLCCPLLGQELGQRGIATRILDMDSRFATVPGFRSYDLYRPAWTGETYDLIICDPPFFKVSLSQLFKAIRTLSRNDFSQPLLLCYLSRRGSNVQGTFGQFGLRASGIAPGYQTVQRTGRNDIEYFTNLPAEKLAPLREQA